MLENYGVTLYEEKVIDNLLKKLMSPHTELNAEVSMCRLSSTHTFVKAYMYLSIVVVILYPFNNPS